METMNNNQNITNQPTRTPKEILLSDLNTPGFVDLQVGDTVVLNDPDSMDDKMLCDCGLPPMAVVDYIELSEDGKKIYVFMAIEKCGCGQPTIMIGYFSGTLFIATPGILTEEERAYQTTRCLELAVLYRVRKQTELLTRHLVN